MDEHPPAPRSADDGTLRLDLPRITARLVAGGVSLALLLLGLDVVVHLAAGPDAGPLRDLLDLSAEDGIGAAVMIAVTLLAAAIAWLAAALRRMRTAGGRAAGWVVVAGFLSWLALDDAAMIHERVGAAIEMAGLRGGFPSYAWQIVFVPVFGGLGLFMLAFLWRRAAPGRDRRRLVAAVALLSLAVLMDFIEGLPRAHALNLCRHVAEALDLETFARERLGRSGYATTRHFVQALEEAVELAGMTLLAAALARAGLGSAVTVQGRATGDAS